MISVLLVLARDKWGLSEGRGPETLLISCSFLFLAEELTETHDDLAG